MDSVERNMVQRVLPYLSEYPIIFDVGSNKGLWTDILIDYVHEVHLIEPNELLLHYTMVKYDSARHVYYCNSAAWREIGRMPFHIIGDEYSGLSGLYKNHRWDYLSTYDVTVDTVTLDHYANSRNIGNVDFIKIDVEGAEYDVLLGCKQLLQDKRVRFIQIEYSEHYKLAGHTLSEVKKYVEGFGYKLLDWNLQPNFTENFELSNYLICMGDFTEDWNKEFVEITQGMKVDFALEIGCFEGLTTCYICDNLLNEGGRMIAVDPLEDTYLTEGLDSEAIKLNESLGYFAGQYERFLRNTKGRPVELVRKASASAYPDLMEYRFDLIYIDGDHRYKYVYWDGCCCFLMLKPGGMMIFDDYEWSEGTKKGIDRFLFEHQPQITVEYRGNKVVVRRNFPLPAE